MDIVVTVEVETEVGPVTVAVVVEAGPVTVAVVVVTGPATVDIEVVGLNMVAVVVEDETVITS